MAPRNVCFSEFDAGRFPTAAEVEEARVHEFGLLVVSKVVANGLTIKQARSTIRALHAAGFGDDEIRQRLVGHKFETILLEALSQPALIALEEKGFAAALYKARGSKDTELLGLRHYSRPYAQNIVDGLQAAHFSLDEIELALLQLDPPLEDATKGLMLLIIAELREAAKKKAAALTAGATNVQLFMSPPPNAGFGIKISAKW